MNITLVALWAHKLFRPDEPQPFGGAELQLYLLANEWASYPDVTVHFITRGKGAYEEYRHNAIRVYKLPYYTSSRRRAVVGSWDIYRKAKSIASSVYIQRSGGIETGLTGWASRHTHTPFVFMCAHDWDVDGTHAKKRGWLYGSLYRSGLRCAAAVVAQSEYQQHYLFAHYQKRSTILRSAHHIPEAVPDIKTGALWVGRCEGFKNPEAFLELVEHLPEIPFTMVCPPANSRERFEAVRQKAETLPNLTFLPGVAFEETEKLFARHKLFICTASKEGFPNTYIQAVKWGTPVVSLTVNPDRILTRYQLGICAHGNGIKQVMSIQELYHDDEPWRKLSANARRYALEHHDIHRIARSLFDWIQSIRRDESVSGLHR